MKELLVRWGLVETEGPGRDGSGVAWAAGRAEMTNRMARPFLGEDERQALAVSLWGAAEQLNKAPETVGVAMNVYAAVREVQAVRRCGDCAHHRAVVQCHKAILRPTHVNGRPDEDFFCALFAPVAR